MNSRWRKPLILFAILGFLVSVLFVGFANVDFSITDKAVRLQKNAERVRLQMARQQYARSEGLVLAGQSGPGLQPGAPLPLKRDKRLLIRTADLRLRVTDLGAAAARVKKIATSHSGYLSKELFKRNDSGQSASFIMRVPNAHFDSAMAGLLKGAAHVAHKSIETKDVTAEFADIGLRLSSKRSAAAQYLRIMRRAGTIKDVLAVQSELRKVREEIEHLEGRLRLLRNRTTYSTIDLTLYVHGWSPKPERGFFSRAALALLSGWNGLLAVLVGSLTIWPLLLLVTLTVFLARRYRLPPFRTNP